MIVVIGAPVYRPADPRVSEGAHGLAWQVAVAAVQAGAAVQFVGKVGDDAAGDALVLALGRAGIGHAAVLRDAGHPTPILATGPGGTAPEDDVEADESLAEALLAEDASDGRALPVASAVEQILPADAAERPRLDAADLDLALRYLGDYRVVVVADELGPDAAEVAAAGAAYANASLVVVVPPGRAVPPALAGATVLEAPPADPDDAFARLVAGYAAALAGGGEAEAAFRAAVEGAGWEVAGSQA